MNIRNELLKEHSKTQTAKIVRYIGNDEERFQELIDLFLNGEYRITQRASWVLSYCVEAYPYLLKPYLKKLIQNLRKPVHDSIKRNTLRCLQFIIIPKSLQGITADICFNFLQNRKEAVAIRVFAMTVLYNISKKEPELGRELKLLIEEQLEMESAGFQSRGKKILKQLSNQRIN